MTKALSKSPKSPATGVRGTAGRQKQPARPFALFVAEIFKGTGRTSRADRVAMMRDAGARWKGLSETEKAKWRTQYSASVAGMVRGGVSPPSGGVSPLSHAQQQPAQTIVAPLPLRDSGHTAVDKSPDLLATHADPGVPRDILASDVREALKGGSMGSVRLGRFTVVDAPRLGCGSFGSVVKVEDQHTRRLYAAKIFLNGDADCRNELEVYACLATSGHQAFLPLLGAHVSPALSWLVLPWWPGSLSRHLRRGAPLEDTVLYGVANQVRAGVHHLHTVGWLHLDLKPGNFLYDPRTRHTAICDFSISERHPVTPKVALRGGTWCTEPYRPPELFRQQCGKYLGPRVDAWSLGCAIFEMGSGKRLFDGDVKEAIAESIRGGVSPCLAGVSRPCAALTAVLCRVVPAQRWDLRLPFPDAVHMTHALHQL